MRCCCFDFYLFFRSIKTGCVQVCGDCARYGVVSRERDHLRMPSLHQNLRQDSLDFFFRVRVIKKKNPKISFWSLPSTGDKWIFSEISDFVTSTSGLFHVRLKIRYTCSFYIYWHWQSLSSLSLRCFLRALFVYSLELQLVMPLALLVRTGCRSMAQAIASTTTNSLGAMPQRLVRISAVVWQYQTLKKSKNLYIKCIKSR